MIHKLRFISDFSGNPETHTINTIKDVDIPNNNLSTILKNDRTGKVVDHLIHRANNVRDINMYDLSREFVNQDTKLQDRHLDEIAKNDDINPSAVRNLPFKEHHLEKLSDNPYVRIRQTVVQNDNHTEKLYNKLRNDSNREVRIASLWSQHSKPEHIHDVYGENDTIEYGDHLIKKVKNFNGKPFKFSAEAYQDSLYDLTEKDSETILKHGSFDSTKGYKTYHSGEFEDAAREGHNSALLYLKTKSPSHYENKHVYDIANSDHMNDELAEVLVDRINDSDIGIHDKTYILNPLQRNEKISLEKRNELIEKSGINKR